MLCLHQAISSCLFFWQQSWSYWKSFHHTPFSPPKSRSEMRKYLWLRWIKSSAKTRGTPWMKETGRVGGNSLCSNANVRLPWLSTGKVLGAPRLLSAQEHDQMSIVYAAVQRSPDSGRWGSVQGHRVWTRQSPGQCVSEASPSSHLQVSKRRSRERLGEIIFRPMADHGGERKSNHMMNFTIVGKSDPHQWHEGDCKIWGIILAGSI